MLGGFILTILVTGSCGLVGAALIKLLKADFEVAEFDIRNSPDEDICRNVPLTNYRGIVHLAAVSRVVTGEQDPARCIRTNVDSLRALYQDALSNHRPWIVFASSREVYGSSGPVQISEDAAYAPKNVYARTKVEGERLSLEARDAGLIVNIARLSSVYGSTADHATRVAPCFARTAATGGTITVEGRDHIFDFTHVDDVAAGLHALVLETDRAQLLPSVHFVSGQGTTLGKLADLAAGFARADVDIVDAPPRPYGVNMFVGDPARAHQLLGWRARIPIEQGLERLVDSFRLVGNLNN